MTHDPLILARRRTGRTREEAGAPRESDEGSSGSDHHPGDKGVEIVSMVLLGVTVLGAVAMLGFNWTMG